MTAKNTHKPESTEQYLTACQNWIMGEIDISETLIEPAIEFGITFDTVLKAVRVSWPDQTPGALEIELYKRALSSIKHARRIKNANQEEELNCLIYALYEDGREDCYNSSAIIGGLCYTLTPEEIFRVIASREII